MTTSLEKLTQRFIESFYIKGGKIYDLITNEEKGYYCRSCGYKRLWFNGKLWLQHRLIYFITHGYLPKRLDHIDRNKLNNKIENLRPAAQSHNVVNSEIRSDNTTGYRGVVNHKLVKGWTAQGSTLDHKRKHLGTFTCKKEAGLAYNYHALSTYGHEFAEFNKVFESVNVGPND